MIRLNLLHLITDQKICQIDSVIIAVQESWSHIDQNMYYLIFLLIFDQDVNHCMYRRVKVPSMKKHGLDMTDLGPSHSNNVSHPEYYFAITITMKGGHHACLRIK